MATVIRFFFAAICFVCSLGSDLGFRASVFYPRIPNRRQCLRYYRN